MRKNLILPLLAALVLVSIILFKTFGIHSEETPTLLSSRESPWPGKRELMEKMWSVRKLLLVYASGDSATTPIYQAHLNKLAKRFSKFEVLIKDEKQVKREDVTSLPVFLLGRQFSTGAITEILHSLPVQTGSSPFEIPKFFKSQEHDVFTLPNFPNPLNRELPVSLISGNSETDIAKFITAAGPYFARVGEFRVFRDGRGIVLGFFNQPGAGAAWQIDYEKSRNYLDTGRKEYDSEHYSFTFVGPGIPTEELGIIADQQEVQFDKFVSDLGLSGEKTEQLKIDFYLYASLEDKGLLTGNTDLAHINLSRKEIHAVLNHDLRGTDFFADASLLSSLLIGKTRSIALRDGLSMYFSKDWGRHGYEFWARKFLTAEMVCSLNELLDSQRYSHESYLLMRPLAGSFVSFLITEFGVEQFLNLYRSWPESGLPKSSLPGFNFATLEAGWRSYLSNLKANTKTSPSPSDRQKHPVFQKGFCYAHEGYQIHNGYLSRKSDESLAKLRTLGTEWISVTPFGYLKDRNKPGYLSYSTGAGAENDESVLASFYAAKRLGMGVMLKPHVLMNSWNFGWPGEIEMKNDKDWKLFFKYYQSWIQHYAILAEMYDFDLFCIGVEFLHATTQKHSGEWRRIIAAIRKIYSGPLVYGANWWQEFEQIEFWDDLDYIGLNCYYPLYDGDSATLEDLKQGVEKFLPNIERVARKYRKPVLLTEIGFTSTAGNWRNPHERKRGSAAYLDDQELSYRAVFESLWEQDWFAGFYWWKWPTYLEYGGPNHSGFTPNGKPAEKVVAEWYSQKEVERSFRD